MSYASQIIADGARALWLLDEASGATAADSTGNGHGGTYHNAAYRVAGPSSALPYAVDLVQASSAYVDVAGGLAVDAANGFSIDGWVFPHSFSTWAKLFDFGNGTDTNNLTLTLSDGISTETSAQVNNAGTSSRAHATRIGSGGWHYVSITCTAAGALKLYIDRVLVATDSGQAPATTARANGYIGKSEWPDPFIDARVAAVATYPTVLTPTQISNHYLAGLAPYPAAVLALNPIAVWRLGEGSGTTAVDATGNGHTGTYVGSPTLGVAGLIAGDTDTAITLAAGKYMSTAASAAYDVAHPAVVAWIKSSAFVGANQMIASQADGSTLNHWYLCFLGDGRISFVVVDGGGNQSADSSASYGNDSTRHMIAAKYDGAHIDLWVDGVRVSSTTYSGTIRSGSGIPVTIGAESNGNFTGPVTVDEVAYFDAANLSDAAIVNLWQVGSGLSTAAEGAVASMSVGAVVTRLGVVAMSAGTGLTATAAGVSGAVAMTATASLSASGIRSRTVSALAARTRSATATDMAELPIDVAYGAGWESVSRQRMAIATVEVQDPDAAEPSDHHRIQRTWLDISGVVFDNPDRLPVQWDFTEHQQDWGRYQIRVSGKDVTWFRGNHTWITELSDTEPGGDDVCTLMFPGIGPFEVIGTGDLDWLPDSGGDAHVPVKILRVKPNGDKVVQFEGDAYAEEDVQDGQGSGLVLHCNGVIKTLDDRITKPRFNSDPLDIATFVHRLIRNEIQYGWPGHPPGLDGTGILTAERGQYGTPLWSDTIQNVLATAQIGEDTQYSLTNSRPRGMKWISKDDTTIDVSAWVGQRGVTHNLANDNTRRYDAIYGEGQAAGIRYWRNTQYPNARAVGDIPAYPVDPSITFSVGDSNASLHLFFDELSSRNYDTQSQDTYLSADLDEVEQFQTDNGLLVDGVIGPQTWVRAFQAGLDANILAAYIRPLMVRDVAEPYLYNSRGGIIGDNPDYNHRMRREVLEQFGTLERRQARHSARMEVHTIHGTNYTGTITFTNIDPPEMCALDIRAGMNISFRHHRGPNDRLLHIVRVDRDPGMMPGSNRTVTLTVSERPDDYITVAERIARHRGVIDQSGRTKVPRRSSARTPDFAPWDEESGAGRLLPIAAFGGLWTVIPIPAGERGEIVHVRLVADRPTLISAAVFNWHTAPNQLTNLPGLANPHVGIGGSNPPDPWQANAKILTDRPEYADQSWLAWASGALDSMQGYYPHDPLTTGSVITGVLDDAASWPYHSRRAPWLWLAIWCSVSCVIGGDPTYKHRALWNAPDTG